MTDRSETTRVLREEHVQILQVADVLERLVSDRAADSRFDTDSADKCVRFIRLFADACHHGKEEDLLFPVMEDAGMSRTDGPIAVMLEDHRLGREFAGAMARALNEMDEGDPGVEQTEAFRRFSRAAHGYVDLIRDHIMKEDHVLFEMADGMVDPSARRSLCDAYDGVCARRFEGCSKAELEALGRELRELYPPIAGG